ncbi:MAG: hypothetical protein H6724_12070 [Sandaracinus sp.]|nr:hypothetical protein [Sandaracinus sp.]MCB9620171.1 hypothetical protein [Sandaracinus sp.]
MRLFAIAFLLLACSDPPVPEAEASSRPGTPTVETPDDEAAEAPRDDVPSDAPPPRQAACADPLPLYADGARTGDVCESELGARGLTTIDLSDAWVPNLFVDDPALGEAGHQPYADIYRALADERFDDVPDEYESEPNLELFGIQPTFRVLLARLDDETRHACHDAIDDAPLAALTFTLHPWAAADRETTLSRQRTVAYLRTRLGREAEARGLADLDALEGDPTWGAHLTRMRRLEAPLRAVEAVQAHLVCDGRLTESAARQNAGVFDWRSASALAAWQREHAIVGGGSLDAETRGFVAEDSRELVFRQLLRTLRERVVDATGRLEDGSASHTWGTVLGRMLDVDAIHFDAGRPPLPNGAPDLVAPATEAAARALGLTDPSHARTTLRALRDAGVDRVAVRLPPAPAYDSASMPLRAEIDRGDVWYERRGGRVEQRPVFTLYVDTPEGEVALVRWPTTIGGWKPERAPSGAIGVRYKESYVGPRVWRDVVASPAWLPPSSTPDDELVRRRNGRWVANRGLFGPGYRSAYGLAMLVLHKVYEPRGEETEPTFVDQGIRVHGSVSYRSITSGTSHGCHRLYNHLAVRLAGFMLAHRPHVRHGSIAVRYGRTAHAHGQAIPIRIESRGYRYELTPPVPIEVLEGRVRGRLREAQTGFRALPAREAAEAVAEAAADE